MRERWGGERGSIGRGSLICTTSAAYILGSGTLNRTYSPLQPCISLWTRSSASRKRRCVAEEKSARSARGGSRTAAAGMRRGAAMRSQHQGLLRDRGRAWATRDPVKRQNCDASAPSSCLVRSESCSSFSYLSLDRPRRQRGQWHLQHKRSRRDGVASLLCASALLTTRGSKRSLFLMTSNALS